MIGCYQIPARRREAIETVVQAAQTPLAFAFQWRLAGRNLSWQSLQWLRISPRLPPAFTDDIDGYAVEVQIRILRLRFDPLFDPSGNAVDGLIRVICAWDAPLPLE